MRFAPEVHEGDTEKFFSYKPSMKAILECTSAILAKKKELQIEKTWHDNVYNSFQQPNTRSDVQKASKARRFFGVFSQVVRKYTVGREQRGWNPGYYIP